MTWFPDLGRESMVAEGEHVRAIGWLSASQPYTCGTVPLDFVEKLSEFVRLANNSAEELCLPAAAGLHTCEFCENSHDTRNFGVPAGDVLYVAPAMVAHYVEDHEYAPPREFVSAVLASPLPGTPAYRSAVKAFREAQQRWMEEQVQSSARLG